MRCKFQQNPPHSFWATAVLKMEQKFPIWKSRLSSSYTKTSVTVCAQSDRRLHGHTRVVEHATVELLGQWCSGRSNTTPRWDAVSSGRHRESCYGRRVSGARPTRGWDLGQGYWAATAKVRWNLVHARQKLHGITSSVSWRIVSEEVSCYGTNRRQKVLIEQDVTIISANNFYTGLNEHHQFGSSK